MLINGGLHTQRTTATIAFFFKRRGEEKECGVAPGYIAFSFFSMPQRLCPKLLSVLHFVNNSLESLGVVEGKVGEHLTVDLDTSLMDEAHELAVGEILHTCGGVDTLNPQSAEVALFVLTVAVGVGKTFFPGIFCYGPYIATASEVTAGKFEDFLSASSGSYVIY